jgi:universal stress protein F
MAKRILAAIDLGHMDDAKKLLLETGRLAKFQSASISIVTVLPDYGTSFVGSFFKDGTLKEAAEQARVALHDLADAILPDHKPVQCIVEIGTVYEQILAAARECDAELIVIGSSKPDLADRVLGPNAARVARQAKVSVWIMR